MRAKDGFMFIITEQPSSSFKKHLPEEWKSLPFAMFGDGKEFLGKLSSPPSSSSSKGGFDCAIFLLDSIGQELFSWTGEEIEEISQFPTVESVFERVKKKQ